MAKVTIEMSGPTSVEGGSRDALKSKKAPKGRNAGKEPNTGNVINRPKDRPAHPSEPVEVPDADIARENARMQKRSATASWIAGRMKTEEHEKIHNRANHVLKGKQPKHFKGASGEQKSKIW